MDTKKTIRKILITIIVPVVAVGMLTLLIAAISEKKRGQCKDYKITIKSADKNLFIDEKDVYKLLSSATGGAVKGQPISAINIRKLETMLENARKPGQGIVASALSLVALVFGAIGVFNELESDLNRIWKVPSTRHAGWWGVVRGRLLSFGMIIAIGFLLLVSLVLSATLAALGSYWSGVFAQLEFLLQAANFALSFGVVTVLFAIIYKFLPQTRIEWGDVWIGAAVTALLFSIGKLLIGLYLGKSSVASSYGAAGSLVILLLWVYYSAQIFLLGAEFTKAYADSHGSLRNAPAAPPRPSPEDRIGTQR